MKNYNQLNMFENGFEMNSGLEELKMNFDYSIPSDWETKFKTYNLDKYINDIENAGLKATWDNICKYVLHNKDVVEFLDVSNFGELYEIALAIEDKKLKKENGQYYTPDDVAFVMSGWLKDLDAENVCDVGCGTGKLILTYLDLDVVQGV